MYSPHMRAFLSAYDCVNGQSEYAFTVRIWPPHSQGE